MHDMDLLPAQPCNAEMPVRVCRADGTQVAVRLRLLGYDGCEFECDEEFTPGEAVSLHLYRMGRIRARIVAREAQVVEAAFDMECPV
jgi:hypothetical protein